MLFSTTTSCILLLLNKPSNNWFVLERIKANSFLSWNKDSVGDDVIRKDLIKISRGRLELPEDMVLSDQKELLSKHRKKKPVRTKKQS